MYSGYKRHHDFKYQAVVCSDDLIDSITGPYKGKINDHVIVWDFDLKRNLQQVCSGCQPLYLFEDQVYKHLNGIFSPYSEEWTLTDDKTVFNHCLSSVQIAIEQAFEQTQNLWTYNAFSTQLCSELQPVTAYYLVSVLLTNCYTCMHSNSAAESQFLVQPSSIKKYLISD